MAGRAAGAGWPADLDRPSSSVTSHDVARLAGVSQATVSRALRRAPNVPAATRERVERAAQALGYVPNRLGRALVTQATGRIAMVADLGNPLFSTLLTPVHDALSELGYQTLLFVEDQTRLEDVSGLFDRSVDGAILSTAIAGSSLPYELDRHGLPFVYLSRISDLVERDSVSADDRGGAAKAARLLIDLGHRDIGAILGPTNTSTSRDREAGFLSELATAGLAVRPEAVVRTDYTTPAGFAAFERLMTLDPRPTALFCGNDWVAVGVLNGAKQRGIEVPRDLTVVGFDDLPVASWPVFDLTTVSNPVKDNAAQAARLLVHRIQSGPKPAFQHVIAPTELVLRHTHAPPPVR